MLSRLGIMLTFNRALDGACHLSYNPGKDKELLKLRYSIQILTKTTE